MTRVTAAPEAEAKRVEQHDLLPAAVALTLPLHLPPYLELALATPVQFWIGARFYRGAGHALRARSGNMDLLLAMGTSAAYLFSLVQLVRLGPGAAGHLDFEAAAVIVTLVFFGRWLEARAKRGTTVANCALMDLNPDVAHVLRDGQEVDLPPARVRLGDPAGQPSTTHAPAD